MLTEKTIADAAKVAGVGERTIYTWLTEPDFRTAVNEQKRTLLENTVRRLASVAPKAVTTLEPIMESKKTPAWCALAELTPYEVGRLSRPG